MTIKQCKCGNNDFDVVESNAYNHAVISNDGILEIGNMAEGGIDTITCSKCGEEYSCKDFERIDFCG